MVSSFEEQKRHVIEYAVARHISVDFTHQLGYGNDGIVWITDQLTAVKAFLRVGNYSRELGCYQRLEELGIDEIGEFEVPSLVDFDADLLIVEMTLVTPPFLLDFGKAHLDHPPDYTPEVLADWESERRELFGDRWPQVQEALGWLQSYGIHYYDAKPGNITFGNEE